MKSTPKDAEFVLNNKILILVSQTTGDALKIKTTVYSGSMERIDKAKNDWWSYNAKKQALDVQYPLQEFRNLEAIYKKEELNDSEQAEVQAREEEFKTILQIAARRAVKKYTELPAADVKIELLDAGEEAARADKADLPDRLAVITHRDFINGLGFRKEGKAYLVPLEKGWLESQKLPFTDGQICFDERTGQADEFEAKLQLHSALRDTSLDANQYVYRLNMPLLYYLYAIILRKFEKNHNQIIHQDIEIRLPDLYRALGMKQIYRSRKQNLDFVRKLDDFANVLGAVKPATENGASKIYFRILDWSYDEESNILKFRSPYFEHLVMRIYNASVRTNKSGETIKSKNGNSKTAPSHSFLIKAEMGNERDYIAFENAVIITVIIERTGTCVSGAEDDKNTEGKEKRAAGRVPHIRVENLIDRNCLFDIKLKQCAPQSRYMIYRRVFRKTWELLKKETLLTEAYKDIKLKDFTKSDDIPIFSDWKAVLEFPHGGKR